MTNILNILRVNIV